MSRILIVEDDQFSADLLLKFLRHGGYAAERVGNGHEALAALEQEAYDLLLLDLMMPGMDGYEVTRRIRQDRRFHRIPIIIISAKDRTHDVAKGLDLGANDYVSKPISREDVMARVRSQLRLKLAQDELTQANVRLQRLSEARGRMVATVSHELRTPLTSIRGALDLVLTTSGDNLSETQEKLLTICLRNTDRLIRLVNSVLDYASIEQMGEGFTMDDVDVAGLVQRAVEEVRAPLPPERLAIDLDIPADLPPVRGDADRLHQVLLNLLANAIQFSPDQAVVTVSAVEDSGTIRLSIRDRGIGMSAEQQEKLFQPFTRLADPGGNDLGGTGLGLVISQDIIHRHGGGIEVESALGVGTVFHVRLPSASGKTHCD